MFAVEMYQEVDSNFFFNSEKHFGSSSLIKGCVDFLFHFKLYEILMHMKGVFFNY